MEDDYISLSLTDKNSGNNVAIIKMEMDKFARALTGLGRQECDFIVDKDDVISWGLNRETKDFFVYEEIFSNTYGKKEREKKLLNYLETNLEFQNLKNDGWDVHNYGLDRQQNSQNYKITLIRFV
jgi:hypothetical protein